MEIKIFVKPSGAEAPVNSDCFDMVEAMGWKEKGADKPEPKAKPKATEAK